MLITVNEYHIQHGTPLSGRFCPLAMAITFRVRGVAQVCEDGSVDLFDVYTRKSRKLGRSPEPYKTIRLPSDADAWRQEYDRTGNGSPITFELPVEA